MIDIAPIITFELTGPDKYKVTVELDGKKLEKEATDKEKHEVSIDLTTQLLLEG